MIPLKLKARYMNLFVVAPLNRTMAVIQLPNSMTAIVLIKQLGTKVVGIWNFATMTLIARTNEAIRNGKGMYLLCLKLSLSSSIEFFF